MPPTERRKASERTMNGASRQTVTISQISPEESWIEIGMA